MPDVLTRSPSRSSLSLQRPLNLHTDSYQHQFPTSIRISRDLSATIAQDLVDHDSLSSMTLTEDPNLAEIAPWATPNNASEPVSLDSLLTLSIFPLLP